MKLFSAPYRLVDRSETNHFKKEWGQRENAGAVVSDQQMRPSSPHYPVDRYLVQNNKHNEIFDIINEDIWNSEPALRPEDEIMLRKLQEMLQSTADDLKILSSEITKCREPGIQIKSTPVPLDEEFNERIHIEEVVNAKFHGHKMIDQKETVTYKAHKDIVDSVIKKIADKQKNRHFITTGIQVNREPLLNETKRKKLTLSRTKTIQINSKNSDVNDPEKVKKYKSNVKQNLKPSVSYGEFSFSYVEPELKAQSQKKLQLQEMPSINIRSELKTQKVLQIDIVPQSECRNNSIENNVAVIALQHKGDREHLPIYNKQPIRKISKMTTCESSESTNNILSHKEQRLKLQKHKKKSMTPSPVTSARNELHKNKDVVNKQKRYSQMYLEQWKRKLNSVYGPSTSKVMKTSTKPKVHKNIDTGLKMPKTTFNNVDYIPYSKLTLGGVRVSDVENEIVNIPNKSEMPLSPILVKILSSRENSFHKNSPRKNKKNEEPKILTTSDENLLQEVLDIQDKVTNTLSENIKSNHEISALSTENDYPDDFDDEKTVNSEHSERQSSDFSQHSISNDFHNQQDNSKNIENKNHNKTFTKLTNLSFKNSVDIFEYRHSIDTQDIAIQSNQTSTISLKGTQTSPRADKPTIQPIRNDLWPTIDPKGEVEKLFKLEKDFIKKLIIDEYGDVLEKSINKPSTSNCTGLQNTERNIAASQKNTQTSPAHVKNVMTSPTITKNRTTSPFIVSKTVNQQTSPILVIKNEEMMNALRNSEDGNDISVNLSSPRFSLRLPQTSHEVLHNIGTYSNRIHYVEPRKHRITPVSSSSSGEADYSSDISSLGEINRKYKQLQRRPRIPSISELSSSSSISKKSSEPSAGMIPLKSEGEVSLGQVGNLKNRKSSTKRHRSDGELSLEFL